jgi:hypothetical protein
MSDLSKIAKRHSDIPQDTLPFDIALPTGGGAGETSTARAVKSVQWARCPNHTPGGKRQLTGLVPDGDQLVFRDHTKTVGKQVVPCPGSGSVWTGRAEDGPA